MKTTRLTLLIILVAVLIFISSQIDQTIPFFSKANLPILFSLLMGWPLAAAILYLTGKMEGVDKKFYPKKSLFIWLYICFGWMCITLVAIAYSSDENVIGLYIVFWSLVPTSYLIVSNMRDEIRKKMSEDKQVSSEVEKGD